MGVRITTGSKAVLYCSTSGVAFGPIFEDYDQAEDFFQWWTARDQRDLRRLTDEELREAYLVWFNSKDED